MVPPPIPMLSLLLLIIERPFLSSGVLDAHIMAMVSAGPKIYFRYQYTCYWKFRVIDIVNAMSVVIAHT
jgi:hypothetical protein